MKLYSESKEIIYSAQNKDPFFSYLSDKLIAPAKKKKQGRILDLGCGSGRNVILAAKMGYDVIGVDISDKALTVAREHAKDEKVADRVRLIRGDILKFKKGEFGLFDFCIVSEVIEHVQDYQKIIYFAYSSLKKGGYLLLSTPNDPGQWNKLDEYAEHVRRFHKSELRQALGAFSEVEIFSVGFPMHRLILSSYSLLLTMLKKSHQPKTFRKDSLFPAIYNAVGKSFLMFDDFFNFTGWGTTLVAIAEK